MATASIAESLLYVADAPKAMAKGIKASKTGTTALAPEIKADREAALSGLPSSMVLSRSREILLVWLGSLTRGL
jgi:hypothetical protein